MEITDIILIYHCLGNHGNMNTCPSYSLFSFVFSLPSPFSLPTTSLGLCQRHLSKRSFLLSTWLRKRHHSHLVGGWSAKRLTYSFSSIFFPFSFFSHACLPLGHGLRQRRQKPLGVQHKHSHGYDSRRREEGLSRPLWTKRVEILPNGVKFRKAFRCPSFLPLSVWWLFHSTRFSSQESPGMTAYR